MEEAISSIQSTIIVFIIYFVGIVCASYFLLLPILKSFGISHQISLALSKIAIVVLAALVFKNQLIT
ncbi:hypothetical protein J7384_18890 [Endozoicomonas sp. G2_1]|uniref:hypothetical protein n=1 Tax=Endozoicomonas sp. G2_1 TaxID=2821091 RepID=UPI001ADA61BA|nr:hypothetical protein [Endozoicomonas sp. G2_1]MBO9492051.1 hypothetical protein [Endozoicomonas sp. G2_1]MBO9492436.1 hypothetical protein [Endozoicomonas sp. G2_1]